jgi:hypothetical protein
MLVQSFSPRAPVSLQRRSAGPSTSDGRATIAGARAPGVRARTDGRGRRPRLDEVPKCGECSFILHCNADDALCALRVIPDWYCTLLERAHDRSHWAHPASGGSSSARVVGHVARLFVRISCALDDIAGGGPGDIAIIDTSAARTLPLVLELEELETSTRQLLSAAATEPSHRPSGLTEEQLRDRRDEVVRRAAHEGVHHGFELARLARLGPAVRRPTELRPAVRRPTELHDDRSRRRASRRAGAYGLILAFPS